MSVRVDVQRVHLRLLRAHVLRRADKLALLGEQRVFRQPLRCRLGNAKVDDLQERLIVLQHYEEVGRLHVAVDDRLLMGVLNRIARLDEQFQPLAGGVVVATAEDGDRLARHVLHYEERSAAVGRPGVVDGGDVGMTQHSECLSLALEAGDHLLGVHPQLDELECNLPSHRMLLLGEEHDAESAFANLLKQLVSPANDGTRLNVPGVAVNTGPARIPSRPIGIATRQRHVQRRPRVRRLRSRKVVVCVRMLYHGDLGKCRSKQLDGYRSLRGGLVQAEQRVAGAEQLSHWAIQPR
jgi:hypothetical protein